MVKISRLFAFLALFLGGCADPVWATCPRVPNPVLLGPVDRVGGHRAAAAQRVGGVHEELSEDVRVSQYGRGNYRVTETYVHADGTGKLTVGVLGATHGDKQLDVRVNEIRTGGWFYMAGGTASSSRWVRVEGDAVRAKEVAQ